MMDAVCSLAFTRGRVAPQTETARHDRTTETTRSANGSQPRVKARGVCGATPTPGIGRTSRFKPIGAEEFEAPTLGNGAPPLSDALPAIRCWDANRIEHGQKAAPASASKQGQPR